MISKRCNSINLLNHVKQKNIKYEVEFNFCKDRYDKNYLKWLSNFTINNKTFKGIGKSKKESIINFMEKANDEIYSLIKVRA